MELSEQAPETPHQPPPEPQKLEGPDWLYKNIEEVSKNAAKVYLVYLGFLAYAALTAISTPDRGLILNDKAHLPIVNIDVSANGFFIVAPLMVMGLFLYLQLYLQRQMRLVAFLNAQYEPMQGRRLYPWIVNIAAFPDSGFLGTLQRLAVALCIWIAPVIVLNVISISYIRKHAPLGVYSVAVLALLGTLAVVFFWKAYGAKNAGKGRTLAWIAIAVVVTFELFVLVGVIPWALRGAPAPYSYWTATARSFVCVDLSYQKLVNEPSVDYQNLHWQNMKEARLEGANLTASVLKRADLSNARLQGAILDQVNLQKARLRHANLEDAALMNASLEGTDLFSANLNRANLFDASLEGAKLRSAQLVSADLPDAKLQGADLSGANLRRANLVRSSFEGAELQNADLQGAAFEGANLRGADLSGAKLKDSLGLTVSQLATTKTLYGADLPAHLLEQMRKQYPHLLAEPKPVKQAREKVDEFLRQMNQGREDEFDRRIEQKGAPEGKSEVEDNGPLPPKGFRVTPVN